MCAKLNLNPPNSLSRMHECDRQMTDHAMEKCRAIPPNNSVWHTYTVSQFIDRKVIYGSSSTYYYYYYYYYCAKWSNSKRGNSSNTKNIIFLLLLPLLLLLLLLYLCSHKGIPIYTCPSPALSKYKLFMNVETRELHAGSSHFSH